MLVSPCVIHRCIRCYQCFFNGVGGCFLFQHRNTLHSPRLPPPPPPNYDNPKSTISSPNFMTTPNTIHKFYLGTVTCSPKFKLPTSFSTPFLYISTLLLSFYVTSHQTCREGGGGGVSQAPDYGAPKKGSKIKVKIKINVKKKVKGFNVILSVFRGVHIYIKILLTFPEQCNLA